MFVIFGILTLASVFVFPFVLSSMIKKQIEKRPANVECIIMCFCGLSVYAWMLSVFSQI